MNHAGEIRLLVNIAEPEVRVWTNVGDAHLGHFESRDAIADAKSEILEGAGNSDVLVCNGDDPLVVARIRQFPGRVVRFGLSPDADVRADAIQDLGLDGGPLYDPDVNYKRVRGKWFDWDDDPAPKPQATRTVDTPPQDGDIRAAAKSGG